MTLTNAEILAALAPQEPTPEMIERAAAHLATSTHF